MKINIKEMAAAAVRAEGILKAMSNRQRLMILCRLIDGEHSVGELAEALGARDSNISQHLALLRKDGLVQPRRDGQTIFYSVASEPARRLIETLYRIYCTPASASVLAKPKALSKKGKVSS